MSNSSDGLPLTAGSANFSKYVALGNSLTSGYSDGALFIEGQKASLHNIMAHNLQQWEAGILKFRLWQTISVDLKLMATGSGARMASTGGGAPTAVAGTPSTEILTSIASEVLTIIVVFQVRKVFICCRQLMVVQQVLL